VLFFSRYDRYHRRWRGSGRNVFLILPLAKSAPVHSYLITPIQSFFLTPIQSFFLTGQAGQAGQAPDGIDSLRSHSTGQAPVRSYFATGQAKDAKSWKLENGKWKREKSFRIFPSWSLLSCITSRKFCEFYL